MRIAIDVTPGVMGHAGIGRYALELARGLRIRRRDMEIRPFSTDPERRRDDGVLGDARWIERPHADRSLRFRVALQYALGGSQDHWLEDCEVFHATDHVLPRLRRVGSVFTLHDLACYRAGETQIVIAISDSTRRDALDHFDLEPERIRTVPMATPPGFAPASSAECEAVRARYGLPERYLLSVGTLEPRKNHALLFRALADAPSDLRLVVVGRRGWKAEGILTALARSGAADRVTLAGFIPDDALPAVYTGACGFLFPSLYEGFGTPVLEALACGVPVAAADVSSLPEVLGDAGLLLPPADVTAWREAMIGFWSADPAAWSRRAAGFERAAAFNWDRTVEGTVVAYREAHAHRG
jgi:glycosyltransferase involved in cell wall biosynthesis